MINICAYLTDIFFQRRNSLSSRFQYYENLSLSKEELQKRKNQCSRHRHKYERPRTPEGIVIILNTILYDTLYIKLYEYYIFICPVVYAMCEFFLKGFGIWIFLKQCQVLIKKIKAEICQLSSTYYLSNLF